MNTTFFRDYDLDLIKEIEEAFEGVLREDGITLHEAEADDDRCSPEEQKNARALDTDNCWKDVPDEHLRNCRNAPSYLDAKGFRYYLPVIMIFTLRFPTEHIADTILYKLIPSPKELDTWNPKAVADWCGLDKLQCEVVVKYLREKFNPYHEGYEEALEKWEKFTE